MRFCKAQCPNFFLCSFILFIFLHLFVICFFFAEAFLGYSFHELNITLLLRVDAIGCLPVFGGDQYFHENTISR